MYLLFPPFTEQFNEHLNDIFILKHQITSIDVDCNDCKSKFVVNYSNNENQTYTFFSSVFAFETEVNAETVILSIKEK